MRVAPVRKVISEKDQIAKPQRAVDLRGLHSSQLLGRRPHETLGKHLLLVPRRIERTSIDRFPSHDLRMTVEGKHLSVLYYLLTFSTAFVGCTIVCSGAGVGS